MGQRTNISSFEELVSISRETLLDGIVVGHPFGNTIGAILRNAAAFGGDVSDTANEFFHAVGAETMSDLKREVVRTTLRWMFEGKKLDEIARFAAMEGSAFGFQSVKKAQLAALKKET